MKFDKLKKIFLVAEIGNNHEGSFKLAKKLVLSAKKCGADAVKFQTFIPEKFVHFSDKKRLSKLKKFQLSFKEFKKLSNFAKKNKIIFFSTPLDIESAKFLNSIQSFFKISSGDNNFFPLIEKIAYFNKDIILSTGLMTIKEIEKTKKFIFNIWKKLNFKRKLSILHCVSSYPVEKQNANLLAIKTLKKKFVSCNVGYSDHTVGITACIAAAALGAKIIEKHFTLDKNYSNFRDHKISANPKEFKDLSDQIKLISLMLGDGKKKISKAEKNNIKSMRRSIAVNQNFIKGQKIEKEQLIWLRPESSYKPGEEKIILNKVLKKNLNKGQFILKKHFKR